MTPLFEPKVYLKEDEHRYFDGNGTEYLGFGRFYDLLCKPFASTPIAMQKAFSMGVDKSVIIAEWEQKKELGSYYDNALTECAKNPLAMDKYPEEKELLKSVLNEYEWCHETYEKLVVYNEQYLIAGEIDKLGVTSHRKGSSFELSDVKVFEKDTLHEHRGWLYEPLDHLPNTKYIKIAFQTSFYAVQLEQLSGRRCRALWIHQINPITKQHWKVPIPFLKNDVLIALEFFKDRIATLVAKQESLF